MALITNTDSTILPYNDDYMVYDLDRQMYILTNKGILDLTGYDMISMSETEIDAERVRYEISQDIYNHIAVFSMYQTYNYKVWLIAKDANLRSLFLRVLADQARYYFRSGAGSLKDMHGVNVGGGKALDLHSLRGNVLVSSSVDALLSSSGLLYTGRMYYTDYSDDGTW